MKRIILLALVCAAPILARADGVTDILINPAGSFIISAPGSYRLAADVTMTQPMLGILVQASNVTLNLNGHTITGSGAGNPDGIATTGSSNVSVMNGTITGFGGAGISLEVGSVIRNCRVTANNKAGGTGGITVQANSIVEGCTVTGNTPLGIGSTDAISTGDNSRIIGNVVEGNNSNSGSVTAILAATGCVIADNVCRNNRVLGGISGVIGISGGLRCLIRDNVVVDNDNLGTGSAIGISALNCTIDGNVCSDHTTGATSTAGAIGISANGSTITNNDCSGNSAAAGSNASGRGISGSNNSRIENNRCDNNNGQGTGNSVGILVSSGCRVEQNQCRAHALGAGGWGIRVLAANNFIGGNVTQQNGAGIIFLGSSNNRAASNLLRETVGFDEINGTMPNSVGTGDLANIIY